MVNKQNGKSILVKINHPTLVQTSSSNPEHSASYDPTHQHHGRNLLDSVAFYRHWNSDGGNSGLVLSAVTFTVTRNRGCKNGHRHCRAILVSRRSPIAEILWDTSCHGCRIQEPNGARSKGSSGRGRGRGRGRNQTRVTS